MILLAITVVAAASCVQAQSTAQTNVAPDLRECYIDPSFTNRNNIPPTTIQVLIDIIQQIEDNRNVNNVLNLRELTCLVLQRYRQDGIEYHQPESTIAATTNVLPFAPTFHSFYRNKLLLSRILPVNLQQLANDTVNSPLKCALHRMLSTTVDSRARDDGNSCNQLSQYRAIRTARSLRKHLLKDDVEMLDVAKLNSAKRSGQMMQYNPKDDIDVRNYNHNDLSERQVVTQSQCPLLDGVISTRWGHVSAGSVLAGIAAGAQPQQIPIENLAKGSVINIPNVQSHVTALYPATISGDLAEAVLIQNTERGSQTISVGAAGGWNSTQARRFFMLQAPNGLNNIEMTDPEIRGGIDGFVLGSVMPTLIQNVNSIRLSQVLDMYYTARNGVLDSTRRACNRRALAQTIPTANLIGETLAFAAALDTNMPLRGTIIGGLEQPVNSAVTNFQTYANNNLNDLSCADTETSTTDFRVKTNLYLAVDASWPFTTIYPAISYLLDKIEVGKYGSSVTLLTTFDGGVVVNKTFSLANFHTEYTLARHLSMLRGVNLESALPSITTLLQTELDNERASNYIGGNSTVLLFLLNSAVQINLEIVQNQARILNDSVPDLRVLYASSTNQLDTLWPLTRDMHNDIVTINLSTDGTNVESNMEGVLRRVSNVGRRIINPTCGANFPPDSLSGNRNFVDFVEPGYINYYSVSPNYFHINHDNRRVRISQSVAGVGNIIVCHSRNFIQPRQTNISIGVETSDVECQTLTVGNTGVEINLRGACDENRPINNCQPFHISVQSVIPTTNTALGSACTERGCRFPYNIRYQVQIEEFGCFSGSGSVTYSLTLLLLALIYNFV
ncbi:uncharacterized protein LOC112056422 [Bicyclus anynana]|uniref:Uncharacterized protein LOC112056422 n=1 Tax=Bicyclus anynana TaxID=110368 RepID=A0A6J1P4H1_BICAN|nr:uncharacterized protein LOC112056422 [Bicyclus anynana]